MDIDQRLNERLIGARVVADLCPFELRCFGELSEGFRVPREVLVFLGECVAKLELARVAWRQRCEQLLERRDVIALRSLGAKLGALDVGLVRAWIELKHPVIVRLGSLEFADEAPHERPIEAKDPLLGRQLDRAIVERARAVLFTDRAIEGADGIDSRGAAPRRVHGGFGGADRLGPSMESLETLGLAQQAACIRRGELDGALCEPERFAKFAELLRDQACQQPSGCKLWVRAGQDPALGLGAGKVSRCESAGDIPVEVCGVGHCCKEPTLAHRARPRSDRRCLRVETPRP